MKIFSIFLKEIHVTKIESYVFKRPLYLESFKNNRSEENFSIEHFLYFDRSINRGTKTFSLKYQVSVLTFL